MSTQSAKAAHFYSLHVPGKPLVLFNIWDPGSAQAVVQSGAEALATGSWSVAKAMGFGDGEKLPLALAIQTCSALFKAANCRLPLIWKAATAPMLRALPRALRWP